MQVVLEWIVTVVLGLGILPSFTALSISLQQAVPEVARYTGPINVLKIAAPFLAFYLWKNHRALPARLLVILGASLVIEAVGTTLAGIPCAFPPGLMREQMVMAIGLLAALCLVILPARKQAVVLVVWAGALYGATLLDLLMPSGVDWLYTNIFDPYTRVLDITEVGQRVITGVWGRQSLGKLLAWTPWLLMAFRFRKPVSPAARAGWAALVILSSATTLATSQRGPFVGALAGLAMFTLYHAVQLKNRKVVYLGVGAMLLTMVATAVIVPRQVLEPRIKSLIGMSQDDPYGKHADVNKNFRLRMAQFSLQVIATHPLGHACISDREFISAGITHFNHAHNMILQQFRERGWLWGATHLLLWIGALSGAWKMRSETGAALAAGVVTVFGLGMFDHPWFVLNHALMLWTFVILGIWAHWLNSNQESSA